MASNILLEGIPTAQARRIGSILSLLEEYLGFLVPLYNEMPPIHQERARRQLALVLSQQEPKNLRLLTVFLHLMNFWCLVRFRRRFRRLNEFEKNHLIRFFFASRLGLLRKGFWGINTLAKLAVYSQESIYNKINYYPKSLPVKSP